MLTALLLATLGIVPLPTDEAPPLTLDQLKRIQSIVHEGDGGLPVTLPPTLMAQVETPASPPPPSPGPKNPDGFDKHLAIGGSVSNAQSTTAVEPYVDVMANFPVSGWTAGCKGAGTGCSKFPRFRVELEAQLAATSSEAGSQPIVATNPLANLGGFKSVAFQGSVHVVFGNAYNARETAFVQAGVSSVLASGPTQPTKANPAHVDVCFGVSTKDHTASASACPLSVTDELGDPATAGRASGRVTLSGPVPLRFGVDVIYPYGNAPSNWYVTNTVHNVLTVVSVSYDFDKVEQSKTSSSGSGNASRFVPRTVSSGP